MGFVGRWAEVVEGFRAVSVDRMLQCGAVRLVKSLEVFKVPGVLDWS